MSVCPWIQYVQGESEVVFAPDRPGGCESDIVTLHSDTSTHTIKHLTTPTLTLFLTRVLKWQLHTKYSR